MRRGKHDYAVLGDFRVLAGILVATAVVVMATALLAGRQSVAPSRTERSAGSSSARQGTAPARLRKVFVRGPSAAPLLRPGAAPPAGVSARATARPRYVPGRLLVKFKDGTTGRTAGTVISGAGGDLQERVGKIDVSVVDVPVGETAGALAQVRASPAVEYAERDVAVSSFDITPNDDLWSTQWGPRVIEAPRAWDTTRGLASVVVAVLDTGAELEHPDLGGAFVEGHDVVDDDADPSDDSGHGTAAAGVIAARTDNGRGGAGICWSCAVMPVKVLKADGSGNTSSLAAGIVWAADHGARVISMSLGGVGRTQTLADAIDYAQRRGIVMVAAAGNSGSSTPNYPAAYPGVLGVAGTTESGPLYSWSNYGDWVQVAAPGCNTAPWLHGEYVEFCGTSSATPLVAGIAALALSASPAATGAQVEEAIRKSAVPLPGSVQNGRVDASRPLAALGAVAPAPTAVASSTSQTFHAVLSGAGGRRFSLALAAGELVGEVQARSRRPLRLTLLDGRGHAIAQALGVGGVALRRRVERGRYQLVVTSTGGRVPFTLVLSTPAAA